MTNGICQISISKISGASKYLPHLVVSIHIALASKGLASTHIHLTRDSKL